METINIKTDVKELQKIMIDKGFRTITSLSIASGVHRNTLGKVLNGEMQPSTDVMFKLVATLELSELDAGRIFFARDLRDA